MLDLEPERPYMPGYGMRPGDGKGRPFPWRWARERLARSHNYWLSTTRPDGRPSASAVWGVWLDDRFLFSMADDSRKARNLARNPHCVVTTEYAGEAVIVEGVLAEADDPALTERARQAYAEKYDWDTEGYDFYIVEPRVAFGFSEGASDFADTATRWRFE